jgi:hypothetical protein
MHRLVWVLLVVGSALHAQTAGFADWHERWGDYVHRSYDWKLLGAVAAESVLDQTFQLSKCGRPPYCFPHHIGRSLARRSARMTIELGAGALLGEDIIRRPSGLSGTRQRIVFALLHAPLAKGPEGQWRPAYSRFIGTMGAVTVSRAWDGRPITAGRLAHSFGWASTSYFQDALLTEFEPDLKRFGATAWRKHIRPVISRLGKGF